MIARRTVLTGIIAAPFLVRPGTLMPVRPLPVRSATDLMTAYFDPRIQSTFWDELDSQLFGRSGFDWRDARP